MKATDVLKTIWGNLKESMLGGVEAVEGYNDTLLLELKRAQVQMVFNPRAKTYSDDFKKEKYTSAFEYGEALRYAWGANVRWSDEYATITRVDENYVDSCIVNVAQMHGAPVAADLCNGLVSCSASSIVSEESLKRYSSLSKILSKITPQTQGQGGAVVWGLFVASGLDTPPIFEEFARPHREALDVASGV